MNPEILLASGSRYRRELLERLQLEFDCRPPDVDESVLAGEDPVDYVRRLAEAKARAIAIDHPSAVVIGSDQCAVLDGRILGKPGAFDRALEQLRAANGRKVMFRTGLCVLRLHTEFRELDEVAYEVEFRRLSDEQLQHYLRSETPYDCAGAIR